MSGRSPRLISVSRGTLLADIAEGELIKLNESGSPVEFYVAKHDYEPDLNGSGRTLLVRKDCYDTRVFSNSSNAFSGSDIDTWLNGTWLKLLDPDIQTAISTTRIYCIAGSGSSTQQPMTLAAFLLSATELGKGMYNDGTALASAVCSKLSIAYLNNSATSQWTRTPYEGSSQYVCDVASNGNLGRSQRSSSSGSRPVFTLPSDFVLTDDML